MYKGNGIANSFPLPKGETGERVILTVGGNCAILSRGEGYEIRDGNVEFYEPLPEGATLVFADAPSDACTSAEAVNRITEGIRVLDALLKEARSFLRVKQDEMDLSVAQAKEFFDRQIDNVGEVLTERYKAITDAAASKLAESMKSDVDKIAELAKQTAEDKEVCGLAEECIDDKIQSFNTQLDKVLDDLVRDAEAESKVYDDAVELIVKGQEDIEKKQKEALKGIDAHIADSRSRLDKMLDDIRSTVIDLTAKVGSVKRKMEAAQTEQVIVKKRS